MRSSSVRQELRDLGFTLALLVAGELVVQVSGWPRFWVFVVALVLGHAARAVLRSRRRPVAAPQEAHQDTASP